MRARIAIKRGIANAKFVTSSKVGIDNSAAPTPRRPPCVKMSDQRNRIVKQVQIPFALKVTKNQISHSGPSNR